MPKISICVPVYNTEDYLRRCIDSVLKQDFTDFEIIIVNDASPDNSWKILEDYSEADLRIILIDKKENEGLMCARKSAYSVAKGDYIMFLDSDDYLEENALSILYQKITSENADIAVSGYNYYPVKGNSRQRVYSLPFGNDRTATFRALLTDFLPHTLWGNLYSRHLFDGDDLTCLKNQTNGEDMLLFYELVAKSNKIVTVGQPLYAYCQNRQSATQVRLSDEKLQNNIEVYGRWYKNMQRCGVLPELVEKKLIGKIQEKLIGGYSPKKVRKYTSEILTDVSLTHITSILGIIGGMKFLSLYYGLLPVNTLKKIPRPIRSLIHKG